MKKNIPQITIFIYFCFTIKLFASELKQINEESIEKQQEPFKIKGEIKSSEEKDDCETKKKNFYITLKEFKNAKKLQESSSNEKEMALKEKLKNQFKEILVCYF